MEYGIKKSTTYYLILFGKPNANSRSFQRIAQASVGVVIFKIAMLRLEGVT
jgi:hypothetical protein